jgi:hypothetical protein
MAAEKERKREREREREGGLRSDARTDSNRVARYTKTVSHMRRLVFFFLFLFLLS